VSGESKPPSLSGRPDIHIPQKRSIAVGRRLLVACARAAFESAFRAEVGPLLREGPDWDWVVETAWTNRAVPLLQCGLAGFSKLVMARDLRLLRAAGRRASARNVAHVEEAATITGGLEGANVQAVVMRGVAYLETIYAGRLGLRDFSDVDLLIKRSDLTSATSCLWGLGFGPPWWALDDRYYEKHHLHLVRVGGDRNVAVEIHWSLDHKHTPYRISTEEILARARRTVGEPCHLLMDPEDTLITACVHAFKHDPLVRHYLEHLSVGDLPFPDRHLMHLVDLAGMVVDGPGPKWPEVVTRCKRWHTELPVWAMLSYASAVLGVGVPLDILDTLRPPRMAWLQRGVSRTVRALVGRPNQRGLGSRRRSKLLRYHLGLGFDPIRLVDLSGYLFPSIEEAKLRWGCRTSLGAIVRLMAHLIVSLMSLTHTLADALYYSAKRNLRLRRTLRGSPSLRELTG
jgi:hypothetical protein